MPFILYTIGALKSSPNHTTFHPIFLLFPLSISFYPQEIPSIYPFIFKKRSCSKSHPTESNLGHLLFGQNIVLLASGITIIQEHTYCFTYSCVVFYVLI